MNARGEATPVEAGARSLTGLTQAEAAHRLEESGPNALPESAPVPLWRRLVRQIRGPLTYILLFAYVFDLGAWLYAGRQGWPIEALAIAAVLGPLIVSFFPALVRIYERPLRGSSRTPMNPGMGNPVSSVPAASSTTAAPDPSVVGTHLAALPPLTNVQRQAFREQFTHAQCTAAAGDRAEGTAVLAEALEWVPLIHDTLSRYPALVRRYGRARFAWLLECIRDLGRAKEIQDTRSTESGTPSARSERNRDAALRARDDLILALGVLAEGNEAERARLAAAMGTTDTNGALGASLHTLARLAADWLEREDHAARGLVASIDLTTADVEAARAAARALSTGDGVPEVHAEGQDPPAVNLAVGRVLLEMGLVLRVFERMHRWDDRVPELVPGPAVRSVLTPAHTEGPKLVDARSERVFQRIEQSGALPAGMRAPEALGAVMGLLSAQLTGGEAVDMAASLPPTLRELLQPFGRHTDQWPDRLTRAEFTEMLAQHLQMTEEQVEAVIHAVFSAVQAVMPTDEVAAVEAQLPDEARRLWVSHRRAA